MGICLLQHKVPHHPLVLMSFVVPVVDRVELVGNFAVGLGRLGLNTDYAKVSNHLEVQKVHSRTGRCPDIQNARPLTS